MRLGYVNPSQFDEYLKHYLNISRASILLLLSEAEKNPDVTISPEFKNRLIRVLLGERN
jgi:hypothetical protein